MPDIAKAWLGALNDYEYEVDLSLFSARSSYPKWFVDRIEGARDATKRFEDRFRSLADRHLEAWYEAVFWKMFFSQRLRIKRRASLSRMLKLPALRLATCTANAMHMF